MLTSKGSSLESSRWSLVRSHGQPWAVPTRPHRRPSPPVATQRRCTLSARALACRPRPGLGALSRKRVHPGPRACRFSWTHLLPFFESHLLLNSESPWRAAHERCQERRPPIAKGRPLQRFSLISLESEREKQMVVNINGALQVTLTSSRGREKPWVSLEIYRERGSQVCSS